ncbi:hypothetical protein J3F83DRAFT_756375 [Trichoderma novae-zelandiae]
MCRVPCMDEQSRCSSRLKLFQSCLIQATRSLSKAVDIRHPHPQPDASSTALQWPVPVMCSAYGFESTYAYLEICEIRASILRHQWTAAVGVVSRPVTPVQHALCHGCLSCSVHSIWPSVSTCYEDLS